VAVLEQEANPASGTHHLSVYVNGANAALPQGGGGLQANERRQGRYKGRFFFEKKKQKTLLRQI
jgi:hypothetical protein